MVDVSCVQRYVSQAAKMEDLALYLIDVSVLEVGQVILVHKVCFHVTSIVHYSSVVPLDFMNRIKL